MQSEIKTFAYGGQQIEFELNEKNVMVNATEMAKVFSKDLYQFTRIDDTKKFIAECLKTANLRFLEIEKEEDLIISKQKSGTWMHRILALKFAAWLNPAFELWVYCTIDDILFGAYRKLEESLKASARRKNRIDELKSELLQHEIYAELQRLELEEKQETHIRGKYNKNQLELFKSTTTGAVN